MSLFKSDAEKKKEAEEGARKELEKQYDEVLSRVRFTSETVNEYQSRTGTEGRNN